MEISGKHYAKYLSTHKLKILFLNCYSSNCCSVKWGKSVSNGLGHLEITK